MAENSEDEETDKPEEPANTGNSEDEETDKPENPVNNPDTPVSVGDIVDETLEEIQYEIYINDAAFPTLTEDTKLKDILKLKSFKDKTWIFFDQKGKKIKDLDVSIENLNRNDSLLDRETNRYNIKAQQVSVEEEDEDEGEEEDKEEEENEEEEEKEAETSAETDDDGGTGGVKDKPEEPELGHADPEAEVQCVEDEAFTVEMKQKLLKGNRRLLYGRIPTPSSIINAEHKMFDIRENIDWDNILYSDLIRSSQIIESSDSFSTSMAESSYISAEVKVKAVGYGAASLGVSHSQSREEQRDANFFSITARSTINCAQILVNHESVRYSAKFMNDLNRLLEGGTTYLSHWKRFFNKYGYFYISKARLGGTAYMSHISESSSMSTTEEQKQEIRASMEASYSFVSASVSMSAGSASSNTSSSSKSRSNKQLNCNGGRPDLCSFASFSEWEQSLNDARFWGITETISVEPFYNLLSMKTKTRIFELVPPHIMLRLENKKEIPDGIDPENPDEQISDFFGSHAIRYRYRTIKTERIGWKNPNKKRIKRIEFIDDALIHGFTLYLEDQIVDKAAQGRTLTGEKWGYMDQYGNRDLRIARLQETEVVNAASIWMDPVDRNIIGLQFRTNMGQSMNIIPPGYMAMQLIDNELYDAAQRKQLIIEEWIKGIADKWVNGNKEMELEMYDHFWNEANVWRKARVMEIKNKNNNGLTLQMQFDNQYDLEQNEDIKILYGRKNCFISATDKERHHREVILYDITSKLRNNDLMLKLKESRIEKDMAYHEDLKTVDKIKRFLQSFENRLKLKDIADSGAEHKKYKWIYNALNELSQHENFDYDIAVKIAMDIRQFVTTKWMDHGDEKEVNRGKEEMMDQLRETVDAHYSYLHHHVQSMCVREEVMGDKLFDLQVEQSDHDDSDQYKNFEGIQFKFLMYN